uniref:Uncharacterized protein n=1 Tax=Anguilla anguilla TaxID=7936 RepID=A0A0E9XH46_ANGAN
MLPVSFFFKYTSKPGLSLPTLFLREHPGHWLPRQRLGVFPVTMEIAVKAFLLLQTGGRENRTSPIGGRDDMLSEPSKTFVWCAEREAGVQFAATPNNHFSISSLAPDFNYT